MNILPKHEFTNSHEDRDCVVCGKPKKYHDGVEEVSRRPDTSGGQKSDIRNPNATEPQRK